MNKNEHSRVTVGRLIDGINNMIKKGLLSREDSVNTPEDEKMCYDERYHPIGTILLHIIPVDEEPGTASFEPEHVSKKLN